MIENICTALGVKLSDLLQFDDNLVFNNITHHQKGEFIAYNNTDIKQIESLYKQLLLEKDRIISLLGQKIK